MSTLANAPSRPSALKSRIAKRKTKVGPQEKASGRKKFGSLALTGTVQVVSFVVLAMIDYLIAIWVATTMIPVAMASVADALGFDPTAANTAGLTVWVVASLALMLFLVVLAVVAMRALWRLRKRVLSWAQSQLKTDAHSSAV